MDSQKRILCPSCSKPFVRRAHMLRHQQQHTNHKSFSCMFCSKQFKRSDVLRGHLFRCEQRGSLAVPKKQEKGRKRSSCDSCVKLRTKCDSETPCTRCKELNKPCTRSLNTQKSQDASDLRTHDQISINFLLNSPRHDDFVERFPIRKSPTEESIEGGGGLLLEQAATPGMSDWADRVENYDAFFGADMSFDSFFGSLEGLSFNLPMLTHQELPGTTQEVLPVTSPALEFRAHEIREHLRNAAITHDNMNGTQHFKDLGPAIELITHSEVDSCIDLYFSYYHRHCPILHRPSFDATSVALPLLMSVMALGAMYSKDSTQLSLLKQLLDLIETYIYGLPGLGVEYEGCLNLAQPAEDDKLQNQFETFQGAYLIVVAQYFSGNTMARKRARLQRFTRVLSIARSFNLPTAQHERVVSITDQESFERWIRKETYIRTMNIMLSLDNAFGIFNNLPPRVELSELDLQLPCDPICFETADYQEMVIYSRFPRPKMKVLDAFQKLFMTQSPTSSRFDPVEKNALNSWDLLIVIHLLYSFVWRQLLSNPLVRLPPTSLPSPSVILDPLKLAIRNWKAIWDEIRASLSPKDLPEMGFESSADSYWTVTRLLVHRFEKKDGEADGASTITKVLELLPLQGDCKNQGSHLRKILEGWS